LLSKEWKAGKGLNVRRTQVNLNNFVPSDNLIMKFGQLKETLKIYVEYHNKLFDLK